MAARLALYKTVAERRWESLIGMAVGAGAALALRAAHVLDGPLLVLVLLVGMVLVLQANNARLRRIGRGTLDLATLGRRYAEDAAARPMALDVLENTLVFSLTLFVVAYIGLPSILTDNPVYAAFIPVLAFLVSLTRAVQTRRAASVPVSAPPAAFGEMLRQRLPLLYLSILICAAAGIAVAQRFADPLRFDILLGAVVSGFLLPTLLFRNKNAPVLPAQTARGEFLRAMAFGVFYWGFAMAVAMAGFGFLSFEQPFAFDVRHAILLFFIVVVCLLGGAAFGAFLWLFGKLISWSPNRPKADR